MKAGIIAVVVVAILGVGGFVLARHSNDTSSNNSTSDNMSSMQSNNTSNDTNSNKPVATTSVEIANMAFSPADITVKKGSTVTWTNKDSVGHTVTADDGSTGVTLDSKVLANGESYKATFNTVGTFKYHCSIHPNMTGSVTVTE